MRAKNPLRSVTARRCIGPTKILTSSRCVEVRISSLMKKSWAVLFLGAALLGDASGATDSLDKLANDFWAWRAKSAPFTGDDVNRLERPGGTRDWSRASLDKQRKDLADFEARVEKND